MLDLYRVALGLEIEDGAAILSGSGVPGGDTAEQDAAVIGSVFYRTDSETNNLQIYYKTSTASNDPSDWSQLASKDYVDMAVEGISWREPARIRDGANTSLANALVDANTDDTIDGVTIAAGDRILFTEFTSDTNNVYIVSGSSGSWVFTEDTNAATDGDAVFIQEGTSADQQWVYDGTGWIQFGGNSVAELGFIRTFIGKATAGSTLPVYTSTDVVTQNSNLVVAISDLDAAIGDRTYTEQNFITNGQALALSVDALDIELQDAVDSIGTQTYTEQNFVTDGESLTASVDALDQALADVIGLTQTEVTNITGATTVDSVLVDDVEAVKWHITVIDEGTPTRKRSYEIFSMHDGTVSSDATQTDFNRSSVLRFPGAGGITGLAISTDVNGTGGAQEMRLRISATNPVTVKATRLEVV